MGSTADWEAQLKQLVRAIGSHRVVFFVQADSANANACLTGPQKTKRIGLVRREVQMLSALPNTAVYLDAAAADSEPAASTANILRQEGVAMARGFATNLTHYDWTAAEVRYGQKISSLLGGKPFVVNTALNGNGPLVPSNRVRWGNEVWCNPGGRALGPLPQVNPAPHVDAFFWVGNPGHSDGPCGDMPGSMRGPAVGVFWPSWANQLWTSSQHAPDFPTWKRR
jgi:endoglucanase